LCKPSEYVILKGVTEYLKYVCVGLLNLTFFVSLYRAIVGIFLIITLFGKYIKRNQCYLTFKKHLFTGVSKSPAPPLT
ncbi:hypothetical protein C0J52_00869, partial [Blattella germanica]